jgi:hypothetical protein
MWGTAAVGWPAGAARQFSTRSTSTSFRALILEGRERHIPEEVWRVEMAKLTTATRYMFACFLTMLALTAIGYWILRPAEWRPELLSLLARSFSEFTHSIGTNNRGWGLLQITLPTLIVLAIWAFIGIFRGRAATKQHFLGTVIPTILATIVVNIGVGGAIYLREVARFVYKDHQSLVSLNAQLTREKESLSTENGLWKHRALTAESNRAKPAAISEPESAKKLVGEFHTVAGSTLEFQSNKLNDRPMVVLIALPGGPELMRKNNDEINRYNQEAALEFFKRFGGPIDSLIRRSRPFGLDTSRLQAHLLDLNSIQMIRLIGDDLNDLGDQLEHITGSKGGQQTRCPGTGSV